MMARRLSLIILQKHENACHWFRNVSSNCLIKTCNAITNCCSVSPPLIPLFADTLLTTRHSTVVFDAKRGWCQMWTRSFCPPLAPPTSPRGRRTWWRSSSRGCCPGQRPPESSWLPMADHGGTWRGDPCRHRRGSGIQSVVKVLRGKHRDLQTHYSRRDVQGFLQRSMPNVNSFLLAAACAIIWTVHTHGCGSKMLFRGHKMLFRGHKILECSSKRPFCRKGCRMSENNDLYWGQMGEWAKPFSQQVGPKGLWKKSIFFNESVDKIAYKSRVTFWIPCLVLLRNHFGDLVAVLLNSVRPARPDARYDGPESSP